MVYLQRVSIIDNFDTFAYILFRYAVMVKPEIAKKIALYWLGQTYDFEKDVWIGEHEFNVANDLEAFDLLCDAEDLEFHIMPNNVSGLLRFHNAHSINKLERWKV